MTTLSQTNQNFSLRTLLNSKDAAMALILVLIIGLMIIPFPPGAIDILVVLNIAISVGMILITMYIGKPTEFSAFPTVLLLVTLFRLGINISASRQILLQGNAGKVIETFGGLVVGGNYVIGVVVFIMLMIIQWVVINSGAGRVAEVAARFTLDALPGKQMSIDADLNAGMIDEDEARVRRREIQGEADFYGSMDGASKFVKGDAIAAIVIMLVNILGGFVVGMVQHNMSALDALQSYVLLTVGSGLSIQIPALLISAAAGLLVTRSTSQESLGEDIIGQLSNLNGLIIGTLIITVLAFIPGIPKLPFFLVGAALGSATFVIQRTQQKVEEEIEPSEEIAIAEPETPQDMLEMINVDPMELEIGYALIPLIENQGDNLLNRITNIRRQIMSELGVVLPVVRVHDNLSIQPQEYRIKIRGEEVARGNLMLGHLLAIPGSGSDKSLQGIATTEPAFGLPSLWISETEQGQAELMGYTVVNPLSVISTHLTEIVRAYSSDLLSRQMVQEMLQQLHLQTPAAVDGVIPELLGLSEVQAVLRNLLQERIPIRDLSGILEVLANNSAVTRDPDILAEAVRQTMARTISNLYRDPAGIMNVFTIAPQLEAILRSSLSNIEQGIGFQIGADVAQNILVRTGEEMEKMALNGHYPILICSREIRLAMRRLVERSLPNLVVLAYSEISSDTKVKSHSMVEIAGLSN